MSSRAVNAMRVLYVTPWGPSLRFGGGRHCYANARALCLLPGATVDYVGPEIDAGLPDLPAGVFGRRVARSFTHLDKARAAFRGRATSLGSLFEEFRRRHGVSGYDLVFVETTLCDFVFDEPGLGRRTICNIHNVEADYMAFNASGWSRLAARNCRRAERRTLESGRMFLVMHDEDTRRLRGVYGAGGGACFWRHPVCSLPPKRRPVPFGERNRVLVFTGSLAERFNEAGLREFLVQCWPAVGDKGHDLVVAGANPSADLTGFLSRQPRVRLIANPPDMETVLRGARMLLVPDMTGTGMKLRVAEAMSLGVPIVGTRAGLRGYEDVSRFGRAVDSVGDMRPAVLDLLSDPAGLASLAEGARQSWTARYSIDVFTKRLHRVLDETGLPGGCREG